MSYSTLGTQNAKSRCGTKQISKEMVGIINSAFRENVAKYIGFAIFKSSNKYEIFEKKKNKKKNHKEAFNI